MIKLIPAFLAGCLLVTPALAQKPTNLDLSKVPEASLMQGLSNTTVCIRLNIFAAKKLTAIIKDLQTQGNLLEDDQKALTSAASDLNDIADVLEVEKLVGMGIAGVLVKTYNYTIEDLNTKLKDVIKAADEGFEDIFKDDDEYDEFAKHFVAKDKLCAEMLGQMISKFASEQNKDP
jgi:hypothetical protein